MADKDNKSKLYNEVAGESLYDKCSIFGKCFVLVNLLIGYLLTGYLFIAATQIDY